MQRRISDYEGKKTVPNPLHLHFFRVTGLLAVSDLVWHRDERDWRVAQWINTSEYVNCFSQFRTTKLENRIDGGMKHEVLLDLNEGFTCPK